jgi:hypothetical protein
LYLTVKPMLAPDANGGRLSLFVAAVTIIKQSIRFEIWATRTDAYGILDQPGYFMS